MNPTGYQQDPPPAYMPQQGQKQPSYPPQYPYQQAPSQPAVTHITCLTQPQPPPLVISRGNCPVCHMGNMYEQYSVVGIILAVLFFPLGLLCCLLMTERVCSHCGVRTG